MAKNKIDKLPSFKSVVLQRLFWIDNDGKTRTADPPLWSFGGYPDPDDVDAVYYAFACADGATDVPEMEETVALFPKLDLLPRPLMYLRLFYLMMDYVERHADDDPTCQWDEDDNDMDIESTFRTMHILEAAYRMGYVDGIRSTKGKPDGEEEDDDED